MRRLGLAIRIDPANHILGLRVNTWVSGLVFVAGLVWFWLSQRSDEPGQRRGLRREKEPPPPESSPSPTQ